MSLFRPQWNVWTKQEIYLCQSHTIKIIHKLASDYMKNNKTIQAQICRRARHNSPRRHKTDVWPTGGRATSNVHNARVLVFSVHFCDRKINPKQKVHTFNLWLFDTNALKL